MKRGYFVHNNDGDQGGLAIVATTAAEAKKIAYHSGELIYGDADWIDLRVKWARHAAIGGLPIGIVEDARDALIRGMYGSLAEYPCDECGKDADVVCYHGRVLCLCCIDHLRGDM